MIIPVDKTYSTHYHEGWDARMSDLFVNPYVLDFESQKYEAWKHGWEDADVELEAENYYEKNILRNIRK